MESNDYFAYDEHTQEIADLDEALLTELTGTEWEESAAQLTPETPLADRLAFYRKLREADTVSPDVAFFLIAWTVEEMANERIGELYNSQYRIQFERMEEEHDIDPMEYLEQGLEDVPEEYEALNVEFGERAHALAIATFQQLGEQEMAKLYKDDPDEYSARYLAGEEYLLGVFEEDEEFDEDEEEK